MTTVHVYFDYKRDSRRTQLFCIASMIIILVFPIFVMYSFIQYRSHPLIELINFCWTRSLQHSTYIISILSYTVLLHNLCERYESLNLLLKKQFLSKTINNFRECKSNTIGLIKFIGQQHCLLTDIMELVNFCYAFQVKYNR